MKYIIYMSNAYGNTAIYGKYDNEEETQTEVERLKKSQERYDNDYWYRRVESND